MPFFAFDCTELLNGLDNFFIPKITINRSLKKQETRHFSKFYVCILMLNLQCFLNSKISSFFFKKNYTNLKKTKISFAT